MFFLGPWTWRSRDPDGVLPAMWLPPIGAQGGVDLRANAMIAAGPTTVGQGLFWSKAALPSPYVALPVDPTAQLTLAQRRAIKRRLGLTALNATTLRDALWEIFTVRADPQGATNAPPLLPGRDGRIELHFAGHAFSRKVTRTSPEWNAIQSRLRLDYRKIREQVLAGLAAPNQHRRFLATLLAKFKTSDASLFIPADLPLETPVAPATTYVDTFTDTTGILLSAHTSDDGKSWTNMVGSFKIGGDFTTNIAKIPFGSGDGSLHTSRLDSDLSSADHFCEGSIAGHRASSPVWQFRGPIARKDSTATQTYYRAGVFNNPSSGGDATDIWATAKVEAGVATGIGSDTTLNAAAGDVIKIEVNGTTIKRFRNGLEQDSVVNSSISGNLRCGITGTLGNFGGDETAWIDNWKAEDLGGGAIVLGIAALSGDGLMNPVGIASAAGAASAAADAALASSAVRVALGAATPVGSASVVPAAARVSAGLSALAANAALGVRLGAFATPAGAVFLVPVETRRFIVAAESGTFAVPVEDRTFRVN